MRRRALVDVVRAIVAASSQVLRRPAGIWPLLSSRINVPQRTIADVWSHFTFPAALPPDMLDVLTEEEPWVGGGAERLLKLRSEK